MLHNLQKQGKYAIQSKDISRTHRERLIENAFLEEVVKGWYVPIKPDEQKAKVRLGMLLSGVFVLHI